MVGGGDEEVVAALADGPVNLDVELAGLPLVFGRPGGWRWLHGLWAPALARQLTAAEAEGMRRCAAGVLQGRGLVDPAVRLLIQAHAWDELRTVIRETAAALHPPVAPDVLTAWYSQLPKQLQSGPEGLLLRGVVDKGRNPATAVQLLERAAEKFRQLEDVLGEAAALSNIGHVSWWRQDRSRLAWGAQRAAELTEKGHVDLLVVAGIAQMFLADLDGEEQRVLDLLAAIPPDAISEERSAGIEWFRAWELLKLGEPERAMPHAEAAVAQAIGTFHSTGIYIQVLIRWFSGEIDAALDRIPALVAATEAAGRAQNVAVERATCALLLAFSGRDQVARDHLSAAQAALPGAGGGSSELTCAVARAVTMIGEGEEDRAGELLAAELAQRPLHHPWTARLHQLFLALSYLLVPPTRAHWDAADLGPRFQTARTLARALAAVRDTGSTTELVALQLPAHGIVQALLPVPWAAELADRAHRGRPAGRTAAARDPRRNRSADC